MGPDPGSDYYEPFTSAITPRPATARIGINPPQWDPNPFYVEITRYLDVFYWILSGLGQVTLSSAYYRCMSGRRENGVDEACSIIEFHWYFMNFRALDLTKATVAVLKGGADGGGEQYGPRFDGPFYQVTGARTPGLGMRRCPGRRGSTMDSKVLSARQSVSRNRGPRIH